MHNAKCIMHNSLFLIVGAPIGCPFVGYVTVVGRLARGPPICRRQIGNRRFPLSDKSEYLVCCNRTVYHRYCSVTLRNRRVEGNPPYEVCFSSNGRPMGAPTNNLIYLRYKRYREGLYLQGIQEMRRRLLKHESSCR